MKLGAGVAAMFVLASCDAVYGLSGRTDDAGVTDDAVDPSIDASTVCPVHPNPEGNDDRDEFLNQNDLCPDTEDLGNNEDGDCQADACDPCPQFGGDLPDDDQDGVGDLCDFAASSGSLDELRFEGFGDKDELILYGFDRHAATGTLRNAFPETAFGWANEKIPTTFQLETRFEVPADSGSWSIGLIFGESVENAPPGPTPNGWAVTLSRFTASETQLRLFRVVNGAFLTQNMDRPAAVPNGRLRLVVRVEGGTITVETHSGGQRNTEIVEFPDSGLSDTHYWGVTVTGGAMGIFDYMTELHHIQ
jgi:hypothetical protein